LNTIGDRISYCRSTLGFSRKEFAEFWGGASVPTLSRWELDTVEPSFKKISSVAEFFCSKGLLVTPEWIKDGGQGAPSLLNMKEFSEDDFDDICENNFLNLNKQIKNFKFYKVTSNFFSPMIRYGDYVGGIEILEGQEKNDNSLAFVLCENTVFVGFLGYNENIFLSNSIGKKMDFPSYSLIAKVHWTAIRP